MKELVTAVKRKGRTKYIEYRLRDSESNTIYNFSEEEILGILKSGEEIKNCNLTDESIEIGEDVIKLTLTNNKDYNLSTLLEKKGLSDYWDYNLNLIKSNEVSTRSREKYKFRCPVGHEFKNSPMNISLIKADELCPQCRGISNKGKTQGKISDIEHIGSLTDCFSYYNSSAVLSGILRNDKSTINNKVNLDDVYTYKCKLDHIVSTDLKSMLRYRRKKQCICSKCDSLMNDILDYFMYNILKLVIDNNTNIYKNYVFASRSTMIKFTIANKKLLIHSFYHKREYKSDFRSKIAENLGYKYVIIQCNMSSTREIETERDIETLDAIYERAKYIVDSLKTNETILSIDPTIDKKLDNLDIENIFYNCAKDVENNIWDRHKELNKDTDKSNNYSNSDKDKMSNTKKDNEQTLNNELIDYDIQNLYSFSEYTIDDKFDLILYEGRKFKASSLQSLLLKIVYFLYITDFLAFAKVVEDPLLRYTVYDREFRIVSTKHYEIRNMTNIPNSCVYVDISFNNSKTLKYLKRIIKVAGINIANIKYRKVK